MKAHRIAPSRWYADADPKDLARMKRQIRRDGAISIRDIDNDEDVLVEKDHPWASRKPSKRVLQLGFYNGDFTISERVGMVKTYELMDRHFGWSRAPPRRRPRRKSANTCSTARYVRRASSAPHRSCTLGCASRPSSMALVERRVRRKDVGASDHSKATPTQHWVTPEALEEHPLASGPAGPYPLALRSADHPARAAESVLRLRSHVRGLCAQGQAQVRLLHAAGAPTATRSSQPSTSRPTARRASC